MSTRKVRNPFTDELVDVPLRRHRKIWDTRPNQETVSTMLGFRVPVPFAAFLAWVYDSSNADVDTCEDLFYASLGIYQADESYRYNSTPPELFPIGTTNMDGDHSGYLVLAPELEMDDYPFCSHWPMDFCRLWVHGPNTYQGLASLIIEREKYGAYDDIPPGEVRFPNTPEWNAAVSRARKSQSSEKKIDESIVVPPDWKYLPSSDGAGVLAHGSLFATDTPLVIDSSGPAEPFLHAAENALRAGHTGTALYYLREGYWFTWRQNPYALCERLCETYDLLGRPSLASVIQERISRWRSN